MNQIFNYLKQGISNLHTVPIFCKKDHVISNMSIFEGNYSGWGTQAVGADTISHPVVHMQILFVDYKSLKTDIVICTLFEEDISSFLFPIYNSTGFIKWSDATEP